jgi:ribosome biogenesis GTPase
LHGFPDLVEGTLECPPNCEHTAAETDCALDAWVAAGRADPRRLASYRRLLASRAGEE